MNDLELGKEKLQKALLEVSKNYLENLELAPEEEVSFSPKLKRKMARLIKSKRKSHWKWLNTPLKKVIAACLAVLILSGALISCTPIREPIVAFFTEVYEKFTEFFFGSENKDVASKTIEEIHTLTYIPEGYELIENRLDNQNKEMRSVWRNDEGKKIEFFQSVLMAKILIDTENAETKVLSNDLKIVIVQKENQIYTFWNDEQYSYTLIVPNLNEEEIVKIISSFR